jgi:hypothetical protein
VKPQGVRCKLGETIEQPCSDDLEHTPEVCEGAHLYNGYPASKDDHDSWGLCTTSVESQTIMTAVLMVKSGMDPHMISGNLGRFDLVGLLPLVRPILYCGLCGVINVPLSRCWSFA